MKGRIFWGGGVLFAAVLATVLAQPANQPAVDESQPTSVMTPTPDASEATAADESRPAPVVTPTSDAQMREAMQPLPPLEPAERPVGETPVPAEAVEAVEEEIPAEPARKLWRITPFLSVGVVYDDNIFSSNENRASDVIWTIPFGFIFELGDFRGGKENFISARWIGVPTFYMDHSDQNAFNQAYSLIAQYRWTKLVARLDSNFSIARTSNREVNEITTTQNFSNTLLFKYDYSEKTSFDLKFSQSASIVESFQNTYQYEVAAGMGYQILPKTNIGLEGVAGVLEQPPSPLQYFQQARFRINWVPTGKLNFKFNGGIEAREFEGNESVRVNPVFSLGLSYQPFDGTSLDLVGYRNVVGSNAIAGQDITATGFEIGLQQRLFQKFLAGVSLGYEHDEYFAAGNAPPTDRVDDFFYARTSVRYSFVRWVSVNVFYEYRNNASTEPTSVFSGNRVGMELAAKF
jgi:hypothetical protein